MNKWRGKFFGKSVLLNDYKFVIDGENILSSEISKLYGGKKRDEEFKRILREMKNGLPFLGDDVDLKDDE